MRDVVATPGHKPPLAHSHGSPDRIPHWLSRKNIMGR